MKNLVLLHGALGNIAQFNPLINELKENYYCHALNFNGHGRQPFHKEFSIEQFAKELDDFIEDNNLEECYIFGHSMGGYVALYSSAMGNQSIKKVITLGTKFLWNKEIASKEASMLDIDKMKEKIPAFVERLKNHHGDDWGKLVLSVKELLISLGNNPVLTDEALKKINIPVTICLGEKDTMVTLEESMDTKSKVKNSNFISLENQPHFFEGVELTVLKKLIQENF